MQKEDAYTLDDLLEKAKVYIKSDEDIELIKKAYLFASKAHAGQLRLTGDDYMLHPLNVALLKYMLMHKLFQQHYFTM